MLVQLLTTLDKGHRKHHTYSQGQDGIFLRRQLRRIQCLRIGLNPFRCVGLLRRQSVRSLHHPNLHSRRPCSADRPRFQSTMFALPLFLLSFFAPRKYASSTHFRGAKGDNPTTLNGHAIISITRFHDEALFNGPRNAESICSISRFGQDLHGPVGIARNLEHAAFDHGCNR